MRVNPLQSIALLGLSIAACSDATGALNTVTLCPEAAWAGIEREGMPWQSIATTRTALPLRGGERIGLARIRSNSLQIFYVTTEQAEATFACEAPATKELHGTVQGPPTSGRYPSSYHIVMGASWTIASYDYPDFTLGGVPNGPADLVATGLDASPGDPGHGPTIIIRRDVDYPAGSTIPVLDFTSAEAFTLQTNTLTVVGAGTFERQVQTQVITKNGTQADLTGASINNDTPLPIYSVPVSRLQNGELNSLTVFGPFGNTATLFYRLPSDRAIELGPRASVPTVTRTGTAPNRTPRIDAASQPEYGSQITLLLCAPQPALVPTVIATKEYFGGTPTTWSLTIPDLLAVQGFPSSWPDPRTSGLCGIIVTDRPYLLSPRSARDGDAYRSAQGPGVLYTP